MNNILSLLQIADSALPIGSVAHSYGLETVIAEQHLTVDQLESYLVDLLKNTGRQEAWMCLMGHRAALLSDVEFSAAWLELNGTVSALRSPHELRSASEKVGRRLLQLMGQIEPTLILDRAWKTKQMHHAPVFGLIGASLEIEERVIVSVFLQQLVKTLVAAAQKLQPLGQRQATAIVWKLKPIIESISNEVDAHLPAAFPGLPEVASLRHPHLTTRLFIS
ncbi:MAG: urease accessory protein UreF [Anaerolineae bacterium]